MYFKLVPTKPNNFKVREKAVTYLMLEWQPPLNIYGSIVGYKVNDIIIVFYMVKSTWLHDNGYNQISHDKWEKLFTRMYFTIKKDVNLFCKVFHDQNRAPVQPIRSPHV